MITRNMCVTNEQDKRCTYEVIMSSGFATIVAVEKKTVLQIRRECLRPWVSSMQCACAIISSVTCPAPPYFSTLSHKRHDIRKNKSYWI